MRINELDKNTGVTQLQLDALEKVLDRVFGNVGIDVEFTRHFLDRVNDARNVKPISIKELGMLFKKEFVKYGKPIAQLGPDAEAVMKDLSSDINIPFALDWNSGSGKLELIAKTVMRKKNFTTPNKEFAVESDNQSGVYNDEKNNVEIHWKRINHPDVPKEHLDVEAYQNGKRVQINNGQAEHYMYLINQEMNETATLGSKINFPGMSDTTVDTKTTSTPKVSTPKPAKPARNRFDKIVNWSKSLFDEENFAESNLFTNARMNAIKAGKDTFKVNGKTYKVTGDTSDEKNAITEDLGSMPPLVDLIVLAVVAQTTVAGIKTAIKTAWKTGKGLKKLKQMAHNAGVELDAKVNPGVYESIILTDSTREQILSKISSSQEKRYYEAALAALDRLVKSKGSQQTVGGYAFDIARSFNGMNAKDLAAMYDSQNETLDEAEVKQSNPLVVLDKLADRSDNNAFPVKFYDGSLIKVTPKKAKKFMDVYYKMADEQRDVINKYIKTKKGFMQAITDFNIPL
tara:strand:- start:77 stop:1618 length:1542 start_codon:yes stop_codon:yes gene_type:complete